MQIYENSYIINSFYAIDKATGNVITAGNDGSIALTAGQTVVFKSLYGEDFVSVNTIVFEAKANMKIQLNDNDRCPLYIPAGEKKGVQYLRVNSFTALTAGTIYFEAMVS